MSLIGHKSPTARTNLPCANVLVSLSTPDNASVLEWGPVHIRKLLPTAIKISPNFPHTGCVNETMFFSPPRGFDTSKDCVYPAADIAQPQWYGGRVHQSNITLMGGWMETTKIISI